MTENKRILAFGAHPDDVEFMCGGTLCRLRDLDYEVHIGHMTLGDMGTAELSRQQIAAIRQQEAQKSAESIGATDHWVGSFDLEIQFDLTTRRRVVDLVRMVDPLIVFSPPESDYMADHETTGKLAREACFCAILPNFFAGPHPHLEHPPYLYYVDPSEGGDVLGQPAPVSTAVDISEVIDRKLEMLACHASQRQWLRRAHGMDQYLEAARQYAAQCAQGYQAEHVERFCQHVRQPHPKDDILKEILGEPERK